ncbi:MAG TPA: hypothetical protein VFO99_15890 [Pyrinomonadaceae bacterium]|nr:hypothetical protein [Pyrinomonadaceae bacterium]
MGGARPFLEGGHLFHFNLTGNRRKIGVDDPRLEDRVADNLCKFDLTESESLLIGRNFGTLTDIQTGPNGNLFVVSIDKDRYSRSSGSVSRVSAGFAQKVGLGHPVQGWQRRSRNGEHNSFLCQAVSGTRSQTAR